ncbi:MAG: IS3 family transposase [Sphaerochaetaceae bacterium]|nr:IS3 family transposase [Sphaerochaetaceae bacterium]
MEKYHFIDKYGKRFGINWLLRKFNLSPNAYYNYLKHRKNAFNKNKEKALKTIKEIYHNYEGKPGYRMMRELLNQKGINLSAQTVRRYMNIELNLKSLTRKVKRYNYKKGGNPYAVFENLLNRDFVPSCRDKTWCTDFTFIYLSNGNKRYNCTIIDLYDRSVVASVNAKRMNSELAIKTVTKAMERRNSPKGVILHSDRGSQFSSKDFVKFCKKKKIIQSMSKPGCPYDNSPMERYFKTLKSEQLKLHNYDTEEQLYEAVNTFAYGWYNNVRPHSFNEGLPPAKVV